MRSYALPLLAALTLIINACGGGSQTATDAGKDSGDASGRGGTTGRGGTGGGAAGRGGSGGGTGGATAGTDGGTAGSTGGSIAGAGGSTGGATAGTGGGTAGSTGGSAAGAGGATGGSGGGAAGRGGSGGTGGSAGRGGSGGSGGSAGSGGTGGGTAGRGGTGGSGGGTGGSAGRGGTGGSAGSSGSGGTTAGTGGSTGGSAAGSGGSSGGATAGNGGATGGSGGATGGSGGTGGTAGSGGTVACANASTCPGGADTDCQMKTCINSFCGLHFTAASTPVTSQTAHDCMQNVCDGLGGVMPAILDSDTPTDDGNACTAETCVSGLPSHPPQPARTACSQNGGTLCNGSSSAPACVVCVAATDCPGTDTLCRKRVCGNQFTCGFSNSAAGTAAEPDAIGNCQKAVCDDMGGVTSIADNTDVPADDGNTCTDDVCATGVPSHPAKTQGAACTQNAAAGVCNGTTCVQCIDASTCGTNTVCRTFTCDGTHTCGHMDQPQGTAAGTDATGNCKKNVCDGAGAITPTPDDTDLPVDGNPCTKDVCTNGTASNPDLPAGTICSTAPDNSKACDGSGACNTVTFRVVRVGTTTGTLSASATAGFVEERHLDGSLGTTVSLPTAAAGSNHMLTVSGSASSDGCLSLSGDGHYLAVAGYDAATGTGSIVSSTNNRVVGRIDIAGTVDTSTFFAMASNGNNARGAATTDGSEFWISGASASGMTNGGVWYNTLGAAGTETHVVSTPSNIRCVAIFGNQLYGSSGSGAFANVFSIGFGTPTGMNQTATSLMAATGSPNGFAMFDLSNAVAGLDTMYVADDVTGLQKWTYNGSTWSLATTLNVAGSTGFRGVAGYVSGGVVTLMASTAEGSPNRLVVFVNDAAGSVVANAPMNTIFRGVALSPHFSAP